MVIRRIVQLQEPFLRSCVRAARVGALVLVTAWSAGAEAAGRAATLSECGRRALADNPTLRISLLEERRTELEIGAARGAFFPTLGSNLGFLRAVAPDRSAPGSASGTAGSSTLTYDLGLGGVLPTGTRYKLGVEGSGFWTDVHATPFSPEFANGLSLSLTQPLLRGWGLRTSLSRLTVARLDHRRSKEEVQAAISDLLLEVVTAYWTLSTRVEEHRIALMSRDLALKQLSLAKRRVQNGTLAAVDLVESEAAVALRERQIILAEREVTLAEHSLLRLMYSHGPPGSSSAMELGQGILPVDEPKVDATGAPLDALIATALRNRPELRASDLAVNAAREELRAASNAALPALDLQVGGGLRSLAGESTFGRSAYAQGAAPPQALVGGFGDAWRRVFTAQAPYVQVALSFELPLSGDHRRQELERRAIAARRLEAERVRRSSEVTLEVRRAHAELQAQLRILGATQHHIDLALRHLAVVETKFKRGLATIFDLLRVQEDVVVARRELVRASRNQAIARAALDRAVGRLPSTFGVTVR